MNKIDLKLLEKSLKKRWSIDYNWRSNKQNDALDNNTKFIYDIRSYSELISAIGNLDDDIKNYALNRWYNFWSAMGVEQIFATHKNVTPNINKFDKLIDFNIDNISLIINHQFSQMDSINHYPTQKKMNKTLSIGFTKTKAKKVEST